MILLVPFQFTGLILGPTVLLLGVLAIFMCIRAARRCGDLPAARRALAFSSTPLAAGIVGAALGLMLLVLFGQPVNDGWLALGNCTLAGLQVSAIPLIWSGCLVKNRRQRLA